MTTTDPAPLPGLDRPHARACAWCGGPIPSTARRDAVTCSQPCRQARHRAATRVRVPATRRPVDAPMRLAYADPPYPGRAHYYRGHCDYAGEVDHAELLARLTSSGYDGWALSTSSDALPAVLPLCPPGIRVAAWHRGPRPHPAARWPLRAWEPVIWWGGRPLDPDPEHRRTDSLSHGVAPMTTLPGRVIGTKPPAFVRWLADLLGALPGDTLDDLYPGSGAVALAWSLATGDPAAPVTRRASSGGYGRDGSAPPAGW